VNGEWGRDELVVRLHHSNASPDDVKRALQTNSGHDPKHGAIAQLIRTIKGSRAI
jgi:hypothetical protein